MWRKRFSTLVVPLVFACAAFAAHVEGEGEAKELKVAEAGSKDAIDLAVRSKSESVACAAFGAYLRQETELSAASALRNIERFAKQKGHFYTCALLVSLETDWQKVADGLADERSPASTALGAAIYATAALGDYLGAEKEARYGEFPRQGAGKGKGRGKAGTQRSKALPPPATAVPRALLTNRDPVTRRLAVMAAAYAADAAAADSIQEFKRGRGLDAAEVFYFARQGTPPEDRALVELVKRTQRIVKPITEPTPELSRYTLDVPDSCLICEALGALGQERYLPILFQMLAHADVRVQRDAARAIGKVASAEAIPTLIQALPTCSWPVLIALCDALGAMPDARAIVPLIRRLDEEKGRMRLDLVHALSSIAGAQQGDTAEEWRGWWAASGTTFAVNSAATAAYRKKIRVQDVRVPGNGFFYGLTIFSDRFCYVVDTSLSMKGGRITSLRDNMTGSINGLKDHVMYNIVDFGGDVVTMYPKALTDSKRMGVQRVEDMPLTLGTRSYDAMERACLLPGVDTIYFLSDGAPVRGQTDAWLHIMRALTLVNRYRPIAVYGIDFDPSPSNQRMMQRIALENFGRHESVEVP